MTRILLICSGSALLISRLENQNFDLDSYLNKAEKIAHQISTHFSDDASGQEKIKILVKQLFNEMGFHSALSIIIIRLTAI